MNKAELVTKIATSCGITKASATDVVETLVTVVAEELKAGNEVALKGFGTFKVRESKARAGRNPATGERIDIPAKTTAVFKAGAKLNSDLA